MTHAVLHAGRWSVALAAGLIAGLMATGMPERTMALETAAYQTIQQDGAIEIRDYPSLLVAEVTVPGTRDQAANAAFRILFDFIDGANTPAAKIEMTAPVTQTGQSIAMTAPVTQEGSGSGPWTVAFVMPSAFTRATLPTPNDDRITIRETRPQRVAAIRFSGRWTDSRFQRRYAELSDWMAARNLPARGQPVFAYYNAPMMPGFLRRNEVLIEIGR